MDYLLNSKSFRWVLVVLALGLLVAATFRLYEAGAYYYEDSYAYLWEDSSATVCDSNTNWADEAEDAAENYDDDTDLSLTWVDDCSDGHDIVNKQHNYGAGGWVGFAYTFTANGTEPCYDWEWTGDCDDNQNKADYAYIIWNTSNSIDDPEWQARHEMGHVFGRSHPEGEECDEPEPSVMISPGSNDGECGNTHYTTLKTYDIAQIDARY